MKMELNSKQVLGQISIVSSSILIPKPESLLSHLHENVSSEEPSLTIKDLTKLYYKILHYKQYIQNECIKI